MSSSVSDRNSTSAADDRQRARPLAELLRGLLPIPAEAAPDRQITNVTDDSRRVRPGSVFTAIRGTQRDGRAFIADAIDRGAEAVVGEDLPADIGAAVRVEVPNARYALAVLAARMHGVDPASAPDFKLLGITGTNGKSTTTFMTAAILRAAHQRCGMLGTVHYDLCSRSFTAHMTTPGAAELCGYLGEVYRAGARTAVMEVSSHALDQQRTDGLRFTAAAFTNLSQDHLDYHGSFENYRAAKARLFAGLPADATAIVNVDDPAHAAMITDCPARVLTFGIDQPADIRAHVVHDSISGTRFRLTCPAGELVLDNALVGKHNVYNALAAVGLALQADATLQSIETGLQSVRNIPGRLQRVPAAGPADVFVDYAHTDDALQNVLRVLRPLAKGRLICVFGCGGDRDRGKRPKMAAAVAAYADQIVVTSDNPRTEDPQRILDDILAGFDAATRATALVDVDRRRAIHAALSLSAPGDVVLIAGKGHEDYQIIGNQRIHFDDVEEAIRAASQLAARSD